nr:sulfotransferase family 2 domain-containing protein [uncultured Microbulbifer sp.]
MVKYKYVFVHIPKSGGTSMLRALKAPTRRNHAPWEIYKEANRFYFDDFFKFTIVRHPVTRIYSAYNYILNGGNGRPADLEFSHHLQITSPTFESFILDYLTPSSVFKHNLFRPQVFFVCNYFDEIVVDHVCKLEHIEDEIIAVFKNLNIPSPENFPHANNTYHSEETPDFSEEIKSAIYELYHSDFRVFGYEISV